MHGTTLGIDLAKHVFHLRGVDARGRVVIQKRVSRSKLRETIAQLLICLIGMKARGSAQYWARELQQLGHTVKLIRPQSLVQSLSPQISQEGAISSVMDRAEQEPEELRLRVRETATMLTEVPCRLIACYKAKGAKLRYTAG